MAPPPPPPPPLPDLLGRVLVAFAGDAAATEVRPAFSLRLWANLLRPLDGGALTMRDLRTATCLSHRALQPLVRDLDRGGWATAEGSGRTRTVALTATGARVAAAWRPIPATVEARWRDRFGADRVDRLRTVLVAPVAGLHWELPHYPASYGAVDATVTGGAGVAGHGTDWAPVPRTGDRAGDRAHGGAVAELPLHALLSQALVALVLDYEAEGHGAFATAATVLRYLGDGATPLAATPYRSGLSIQARYTLKRFGLAHVERDVVHITPRGRAWRDAYEPTLGRVTDAWRERFGRVAVAELAGAAEALAADLPADLPTYPLDA